MAYLLTQEASVIKQNRSSRDRKKEDRREAVTEVSIKLCLQIGLCLRGRYSLVFIDEGHQLELLFSINAGAIEWRTLKISTCYSADSVSRPHIILASNFCISYLWLLRVLTLYCIIFKSEEYINK